MTEQQKIAKKDIVNMIFKFAKRRFGMDIQVTKNTTFEDLKFDKFDILYMVMACEEYFDVNIPITEVGLIKDIKTLTNSVCSKLSLVGRLMVPENPNQIKKVQVPATSAEAVIMPAEPAIEPSEPTEEDAEVVEEKPTNVEVIMDEPTTAEEENTPNPAEELKKLTDRAQEVLNLTDEQKESLAQKCEQLEQQLDSTEKQDE